MITIEQIHEWIPNIKDVQPQAEKIISTLDTKKLTFTRGGIELSYRNFESLCHDMKHDGRCLQGMEMLMHFCFEQLPEKMNLMQTVMKQAYGILLFDLKKRIHFIEMIEKFYEEQVETRNAVIEENKQLREKYEQIKIQQNIHKKHLNQTIVRYNELIGILKLEGQEFIKEQDKLKPFFQKVKVQIHRTHDWLDSHLNLLKEINEQEQKIEKPVEEKKEEVQEDEPETQRKDKTDIVVSEVANRIFDVDDPIERIALTNTEFKIAKQNKQIPKNMKENLFQRKVEEELIRLKNENKDD
jgi:hypothetical protein